MSSHEIVVQGHIRSDGQLVADQPIDLPPGPVSITVHALPAPSAAEDTRRVLEEIWAERRLRGIKPRTKAQIDAEIDALRNASEAHT